MLSRNLPGTLRFLFTTSLIAGLCACGDNPAEIIAGDYTGQMVGAVIDDTYDITLAAVDSDTVSVRGADFAAFKIDVMGDASGVTSVADDPYELSWTDGDLSINGPDMSFSGTGGQADGRGSNGDDDDAVIGDDDDDDDDSVIGDDDDDTTVRTDSGLGSAAEGTYRGLAAGIVNDTSYVLSVVSNGPDSARVSGDGITAFNVPLAKDGSALQQGNWSDGTFRLTGDQLELTHTPQSFTFSGSR